MRTNHTFAISAIVRRNKINSRGEVPIYLRIIIDGKRTELAIKHVLKPENWDPATGRAIGKSALTKAINETIDILTLKAKQQYNKYSEAGKAIDIDVIKNGILGIEEQQPTLLDVFKNMADDVLAKVGVNYTYSCYCAYSASINHIRAFLKVKFQREDIRLKELNYAFISDYEVYLKTVGKCRQNGAIKHIQRLKMAVKLAMKNEFLEKDPFIRHSISKDKVIRHPLNDDELLRIQQRVFSSDRLNTIKDMFLFTCYTGLSFKDVKLLVSGNIGKGIDGEEWIFIERSKTGNPCKIPLLPPAKTIIDKYQNHPTRIDTGYLLPIPSNQKFNEYLKEIAELCSIRKKLTVHIGRHTFATTIALQNGVPLEVIKEMLGHDRIETTEIYAKVKDQTIANAMKQLREKLKVAE